MVRGAKCMKMYGAGYVARNRDIGYKKCIWNTEGKPLENHILQ
jgi:hypothetical protein